MVNYVINIITFVLKRFNTNLWAENHLILLDRTKFDTEQISSKFLLEIMTPIKSANNIVSGIEFVLRGRSVICIMINLLVLELFF